MKILTKVVKSRIDDEGLEHIVQARCGYCHEDLDMDPTSPEEISEVIPKHGNPFDAHNDCAKESGHKHEDYEGNYLEVQGYRAEALEMELDTPLEAKQIRRYIKGRCLTYSIDDAVRYAKNVPTENKKAGDKPVGFRQELISLITDLYAGVVEYNGCSPAERRIRRLIGGYIVGAVIIAYICNRFMSGDEEEAPLAAQLQLTHVEDRFPKRPNFNERDYDNDRLVKTRDYEQELAIEQMRILRENS